MALNKSDTIIIFIWSPSVCSLAYYLLLLLYNIYIAPYFLHSKALYIKHFNICCQLYEFAKTKTSAKIDGIASGGGGVGVHFKLTGVCKYAEKACATQPFLYLLIYPKLSTPLVIFR